MINEYCCVNIMFRIVIKKRIEKKDEKTKEYGRGTLAKGLCVRDENPYCIRFYRCIYEIVHDIEGVN